MDKESIIILEHLTDKVVEYMGKEYIVYSVKKAADRNIITTNKMTLALFYSELQKIKILRNSTIKDRIKTNITNNVLVEKRKTIDKKQNTYEPTDKKKKDKGQTIDVSDEDEKFIVENWLILGTRECRIELDLPLDAIKRIVDKHGLRDKKTEIKTTRHKFSDEDDEKLRENYNTMTLENLGKMFGVTPLTISNHAKRLELPKKTRFAKPPEFKIDEEVTKNSDIELFKKRPKINVDVDASNMCEEHKKSHIEVVGLMPTIKISKPLGRKRKEYTTEQKEQILKLWNEGEKASNIQKILSITHFLWIKNIDSLNLPVREKPKRDLGTNVLKTFSEEKKKEILKLWKDGKSASSIQSILGISYFLWKKNVDSLNLPEQDRTTKNSRGKIIRHLTNDEIDKIRENWMHKPIEWFLKELDVDYSVLNRLVKPLNLPTKRKIWSGEAKPKTIARYKQLCDTIENYEKLFDFILSTQNTGDTILLKKENGINKVLDDSGKELWSSDDALKEFKKIEYFKTSKPWNDEDDSYIRRHFILYIKGRNDHLRSILITKGIVLNIYPISRKDLIDIIEFQTFNELMSEMSTKIGRREYSIKNRMVKLGMIWFGEEIKSENISSKQH